MPAATYASILGRDETIVQPTPKTEVVAVIDVVEVPAAAEKKEYKNEVDPSALRLALNFYDTKRSTITETTRRSDLAKIFAETYPQTTIDFAVVLFALAKGLRCVNVFNRGQNLEWREPHKQTLNKLRREMKKPVKVDHFDEPAPTPVKTAPVPAPTPSAPVKKAPETSKPVEPIRQPKFEAETVKIDSNDILGSMASIIKQINLLDSEITELMPFHEQHLLQIARIEKGQRTSITEKLHDLHTGQAKEIEMALDAMTSEIAELKKRKNELCEKLSSL